MCWKRALHWPGEAIPGCSQASKVEPSGKQDFLQQGGKEQAGRNTPALADSAPGHRMGWARSSFPSVFQAVAIRPCWRWGTPSRTGWTSPALPWAGSLSWRAGAQGDTGLSLSLAHQHGLASVLQINSLTWIYFYLSGRLGSKSASQNKAHFFNGILKTIAAL